jgi:hypothetical protein
MALTVPCLAGDAPELGLFVRFDSPPSPYFLKQMQQELAKVLPVFRLHWLNNGDNNAGSYRRIVFVTFHGTCSTSPNKSPQQEAGPPALGETQRVDGAILPFSDIDCDRLSSFIDTVDAADTGRDSRLGMAGGRVLAHELYHVLLQTSSHTKTGIGKAVYSPAALLSRSLRFEQSELELLSSRYR